MKKLHGILQPKTPSQAKFLPMETFPFVHQERGHGDRLSNGSDSLFAVVVCRTSTRRKLPCTPIL